MQATSLDVLQRITLPHWENIGTISSVTVTVTDAAW